MSTDSVLWFPARECKVGREEETFAKSGLALSIYYLLRVLCIEKRLPCPFLQCLGEHVSLAPTLRAPPCLLLLLSSHPSVTLGF